VVDQTPQIVDRARKKKVLIGAFVTFSFPEIFDTLFYMVHPAHANCVLMISESAHSSWYAAEASSPRYAADVTC
jgi:hypothetical protein